MRRASFDPRAVRRLPALPILWLLLAVPPAPAATPTVALPFAEALVQALDTDGALRLARANLEVLRAQQRQLRSRFFPSAGLSASHGRATADELGAPVDRQVRRSEGFLRWNLYSGGADRLALDAAALEVAAGEADLRQALQEACERAAKAYVELLRQQRLRQLAERRLGEVEDLARRVQRQVEAGRTAASDGQLAQAALIDARLALDGVEADLAAAQAQLALATGRPGASLQALAWTPPRAGDAAAPLADWWARSDAGHPPLLALAARRAAALARVPRIAPEYLPRLDLELRRTLSDRTTPQVSSVERRQWTLGLSLEVPLGGAAEARRDEARARADAADGDWWRSVQATRGELAAVRAQALQFAEALPALARQHAQLDEVVRASDLQYQAGRRSLQQLIDQRDRRFASAQREADTEARLALAWLRLDALVGALAAALGAAAPEPELGAPAELPSASPPAAPD